MPFQFIRISDRRRVSRSVRNVTASRGLCFGKKYTLPINLVHKLTALAYRDRQLLDDSFTASVACSYKIMRFSFLNTRTMAQIFAAATATASAGVILLVVAV